uniref:Uncharacterized protein n=1 Tax=viral metagenome TaxID=1070528 RepID=A0A6C0B0A0_9ZZZZ
MGLLSSLFGKKKRKACDRRKKSCRRPRRYNVPGSPCNKLKRKTCKSTTGCRYVKKRGCRRAKGFAKIVAMGVVPAVNEQVEQAGAAAAAAAADAGAPIADQAMAAAAAAADVAAENVIAVGGSPAAAHDAAIEAAGVAAQEVLVEAGASPEQAVAALENAVAAVEAAPPPPPPPPPPPKARPISATNLPYMDELAQRLKARGVVEFGRRRRRYGFGSSKCSTLPRTGNMDQDIRTCLNYTEGGLYPCNWSGGANNRCQKRPNAVTQLYASTVGKYMSYVMATSPALASMTPPPVPVAVAPMIPSAVRESLTEACKGLSERNCGYNPNCQWVGNKKCQARRGTEGVNEIYYGPMGPSGSVTPASVAAAEAAELMFGRRRRFAGFGKKKRYNVTGSGCNRLRKRVCKSNPNCSYTKRGCRRRSGTATKGVVYEGPSLAFGKKRKVHRRKGCKSKKLPAKIRKMCRRLKIKTTKKVGSRRVCKSLSSLKKQIARKLRRMKKSVRKTHRKTKVHRRRR